MKVRKKQRRGFLILCLVVVLLCMTASGCAFVNVSLFRKARPLQEKVIEGDGPGKILLMDISGVLAYEKENNSNPFRPERLSEHINLLARVKEELDKASKDTEVRAVILRINSPGGTVSASDLLHHEITRFKKKKHLKVVACFMGLAASGGYYVATAADYIIAQPTSLTGSIGTIAFKFNIQGLMDKVGVEEESIKSGDKKDIWSLFRPATPEERKILQGIIDDFQGSFLEVVRAGRQQLTEKDLTIIEDGRIFSGRQALDLHLVDELGYLEDAVKWARDTTGMPQAKVVVYYRPGTYVDNVYSMSQGEVWSLQDRIERNGGPMSESATQFMYLWQP